MSNRSSRTSFTTANPKSAFGELSTVHNTPVIQYMSMYGKQNNQEVDVVSGLGGTVTNADAITSLNITTTQGSTAALVSKRSTHYRPGQGVDIRFTAMYNLGITGSYQYAGIGTFSNGFFFGYNGSNFGVCRRYNGKAHIVKLTISTAFTATATVTITLNSVPYTFSSANASASLSYTAHQFEAPSYGGLWEVEHIGSDIYFIAKSDGAKSGTYSVGWSTSGGNGSFSTVTVGVSASEDWVYQTAWNYDKMNGSGISKMTINPQKLNVYRIQFGYLGVASPKFYIMDDDNSEYRLVHMIDYPNSNTQPSLSNPHMRMLYNIKSVTSTTAMSMGMVSFYAASEGPIYRFEPRYSVNASKAVTTENVIITLKNSPIYNGYINHSEIFLTFLSLSTTGNQPVIIRMYKNATLSPVPTTTNFTDFVNVDVDNSTSLYDVTSDSITGSTKLLFTFNLAKDDSRTIDLNDLSIILLRNETISITAQSGASNTVTCALSFIEDH